MEDKVIVLHDIIDDWERQRALRARKFEEVKEGRLEEYCRVWLEYLEDDFPFDNTYIRMHNQRLEVHRDVEDSNRREIMTIYFREDWETKEFTKLETGVYSSSEDSRWELERLTTVGSVANVLLDYYDDILAALNTVKVEWSERYSNAFADLKKADSMIQHWNSEKNKLFLDHAENLLMGEGLIFSDRLASFDLRWDYHVSAIKSIKVVDTSTSGKTATIVIEQYYSYRDELVKRSFEKVRVSKLRELLWQYRDYVLLPNLKVPEVA